MTDGAFAPPAATTPTPASQPTPRRDSRFFTTRDGLRLHYFDYPAEAGEGPARSHPPASHPPASRLPVICLPGLTRPADDFDAAAPRLAAQGRRVVALDHRGRGRSDYDPDWSHYSMHEEQQDIFELLALLNIDRAVFIGTSRGGMHVMKLAHARPGLVRAAVLNDIGPKIELDGLLRIKKYVGKLPPLRSLSDAAGLMKLTAGQHFTNVDAGQWERYARMTFEEREGGVFLRFDPELSHTLDTVEPGKEPETMWDEFLALRGTPTLGVRGGSTDLLSQETFDEMARRLPDFRQLTVPGQGHAPLLLDAPTLAVIAGFVNEQD